MIGEEVPLIEHRLEEFLKAYPDRSSRYISTASLKEVLTVLKKRQIEIDRLREQVRELDRANGADRTEGLTYSEVAAALTETGYVKEGDTWRKGRGKGNEPDNHLPAVSSWYETYHHAAYCRRSEDLRVPVRQRVSDEDTACSNTQHFVPDKDETMFGDSKMTTTERTSDASLCRRIYEALGWTRIEILDVTGELVGNPPRFTHRSWSSTVLPRPDVDAAACMEVMEYLFNQGWRIDNAGKQRVSTAEEQPYYFILRQYDSDTNDFSKCEGTGMWLEQAFARAAADALER